MSMATLQRQACSKTGSTRPRAAAGSFSRALARLSSASLCRAESFCGRRQEKVTRPGVRCAAPARLPWRSVDTPLGPSGALQALEYALRLFRNLAEECRRHSDGDRHVIGCRQMQDRLGILLRNADPDLFDRNDIAVHSLSGFQGIARDAPS